MKEIVRQFGGAAIASLVAALLIMLVCRVPFEGHRGLAEAIAAAGSESHVLEKVSDPVFDRCWRGR